MAEKRKRDRVNEAVADLVRVFRTSGSKHEANRLAAPIMEQLSREPSFLTAILERYVKTPGTLDRGNYPVVGVDIALNPWFGLVANCWVPLPDRTTTLSTKAIHHHKDLLLTTATLHGAGYEHWMFTTPAKVVDRIYRMDLIDAAPHPKHSVSFVNAWIPHTLFYPKELSITLALWSSRFPTTFKDRIKRVPVIRQNTALLKRAAVALGLTRALELKLIGDMDFFPVEGGFEIMPVRKEFERGPNEDHVHSVFHTLQATGNSHLARVIHQQLANGAIKVGAATVQRLLPDLERDRPIEGRLSQGHYGVPYANFTREAIMRAVGASKKEDVNGRKFAATPRGEEAPSARPD